MLHAKCMKTKDLNEKSKRETFSMGILYYADDSCALI